MSNTWRRSRTHWDEGDYGEPRDFKKKKKKKDQKIEIRKQKEQFFEKEVADLRDIKW